MIRTVPQSHGVQHAKSALSSLFLEDIPIDHGKDDIIQRRELRQQIEALEDKTDLAISGIGQRTVPEPRDLFPIELVRAATRTVETTQNIHQRRFPSARGPHDRDELPLGDRKIDLRQDRHLLLPDIIALANIRQADDFIRFLFHLHYTGPPGPWRLFLFVGVEVFSCETVPLTTISCPSERPLVTSISFSVEIPVVT